jgi:PAS domain-containing protein
VPTNTDGPNTEPLPEPGPCEIEDDTGPGPTRADLQESERRYRRLFETAQDGILILDADTGEVLDANPFMGQVPLHPEQPGATSSRTLSA